MSGPETLVERLEERTASYDLCCPSAKQTTDLIREAAAELSALRERCETAERALGHEIRIKCEAIADYRREKAARDEAVAALEEAAERYTVFRQLLVETMDTSPPTEGAQEFISRLTDAMEAAADKLDASPAPPPGDAT